MTSTQAPEGIREYQPAPGVLTWELCNEARRNAVSPAVLRFIAARCPKLEEQVVILKGAGELAFCSGFDLRALRADPASPHMPDHDLIVATEAMTHARATFVAAIDGLAIGAGVELASTCDVRIATERASFRVPALKLGVVYHADGLARIQAAFGAALTTRMILLQEKVGPQEALAAGAVVRVVQSSQLETHLHQLSDELRGAVGLSLRGNRQLLRALSRGHLEPEAKSRHEQLRRHAYASHEHRAAAQKLAELNKRSG